MIDVLAAAIGMKAEDDEGKAGQQLADYGQQVGFADPLAAGDQLPLGDDVDGIDMVEPLDSVVVALMDSIDADEPGTTLGCGRAPGANTAGPSLGLAVMDPALLVAPDSSASTPSIVPS